MKAWSTAVCLEGVRGAERAPITSYNSYSVIDIKDIISRTRKAEIAEGKPKRKLSPVSTYLLDELIRKYFEEDAPRGTILQMIVIKDEKQYGI